MKLMNLNAAFLAVSLVVSTAVTQAVTIDLVSVSNPLNTADTRVMDDGTTGYGAVDKSFAISKFEITAGQYTEFLNAVAKADPYGLYNISMANATTMGCDIERTVVSGEYLYRVTIDGSNRPVNYVSWGDALRFANWLHNGQPTGAEDLTTTEDGAYYLNGITSDLSLMTVTRKAGAKYWIPSENEWYKAAYYDPNKPGGPGYWTYPTKNDTVPSNVLSPTGDNNANYLYSIGSPYRTEFGAFANSPSAYGTYDQGGNVREWNETAQNSVSRSIRGGAFNMAASAMAASSRGIALPGFPPSYEQTDLGFRVASIPEPGGIVLLFTGAMGLVMKRLRRKS